MDPLSSGFLPGAAVKFLRSGTSSANFVLFNELNPLPDQNHNLFAVPLTNHVGGKFLVFAQSSQVVLYLKNKIRTTEKRWVGSVSEVQTLLSKITLKAFESGKCYKISNLVHNVND